MPFFDDGVFETSLEGLRSCAVVSLSGRCDAPVVLWRSLTVRLRSGPGVVARGYCAEHARTVEVPEGAVTLSTWDEVVVSMVLSS